MKVLLVNTLYAPIRFGGVERMVQSLAENLLALGHDVAVATIASAGARTRDVNGVRVHDVPLRNVYPLLPVQQRHALLKPLWHAIDTSNRSMARRVGEIVDRETPDLVHTHNLTGFSTLAWEAVARRGVPIVHTLHDYYLLCLRSTMFHRGRPQTGPHVPCAFFSRPRVRRASLVSAAVGVSRSVLDAHTRAGVFGSTRSRSVIANPAIVPATIGARKESRAGLRIGYLGRLEPIKGVHVLLDAVRPLRATGWTLEIAGLGEERYTRALREQAAGAPIRFSGTVDIADFFHDIDVLVVPSLAPETFGMVVAEAHAFGVPAVVSNRGGLAEIVAEGRTGFIVEADRSDALQVVLARLIATPGIARDMRAQCQAAAERFAPAHIARQYSQLYASLTSRSRMSAV